MGEVPAGYGRNFLFAGTPEFERCCMPQGLDINFRQGSVSNDINHLGRSPAKALSRLTGLWLLRRIV